MVAHTSPDRRSSRLLPAALVLGAIGILSVAIACDKVPLLAPSGSVITIIPASTNVPLNGQIGLVVTVIENGTTGTTGGTGSTGSTSTAGAGTPVQNGTLVSFTSNIGRIEPAEARTNNGQVRVQFVSGGTSGTATITAFSGGASAKLEGLKVGVAAAERVIVTATQQTLGSGGGSTEILANVLDTGGTGVAGIPVTFTTTAGTVNPTSAVTDSSGIARTTLTTGVAADVTATVGDKTGKVTVGLTASLGLGLTATPNPATAGVPTTFTIAVSSTAGTLARDVVLNYGDGAQESLGNVSGNTQRAHVYGSSGTYTATVSATDAGGTRQTASTSVIVGTLSVTVTASPSTTTVGNPVTFTANIGGTATPVSRYVWTYDDGTVQETSGNSTSRVFDSRGTKTIRVDVFGVNGNKIGTATTQVNIT